MIRRLARRLKSSDDSGYVLAVVIGLGLVMLLMVATTLTVTTTGEQKSATDTDWNAALAAAYAGVEDYKSRIENDSSYARYGNPSDPYTAASTGITLPTGSSANPAFNITATQPWAVVPGSGGKAEFRYEIDNSHYGSTGVIELRSTGKVGNETRSVIADLKQNGFNDYVYYTNFEVQDPTISGESASCGNYYWIRPGSCQNIQFASGDVLRGKVHSNDRLLVCGSDFKGAVTTASQTNPLYAINGGCSDATWEAGKPVKTQSIDMPPTNQTMPLETRNDLPAQVPHPGCMYTGPTSIKLNSNGTITVISPWTKYTNISATPGGSTNPAGCGKPGTATGQLGSTGGATFATPADNLIFVQNVPATSSDPNYWSSTAKPTNFTCTTGTTNGRSKEGFVFGSFAYPTTNEDPPLTSTVSAPAYGCRNGDAYTSGTLQGHLTIATQNYIYVVGDLLYNNNQQDLLGLVAQNAVWIWNPMKNINSSGPSGTALLGQNRTIYGAILSVAHTFQVQNYQIGGARGTLKVVGSIAQNFRGTVGQGSNGFLKDYGYDTRLTYSSPPKFLMPTSTTYNTTQVAGVPAAFNANGGLN
jgi:Tfp pilus assembly protein PilX